MCQRARSSLLALLPPLEMWDWVQSGSHAPSLHYGRSELGVLVGNIQKGHHISSLSNLGHMFQGSNSCQSSWEPGEPEECGGLVSPSTHSFCCEPVTLLRLKQAPFGFVLFCVLETESYYVTLAGPELTT